VVCTWTRISPLRDLFLLDCYLRVLIWCLVQNCAGSVHQLNGISRLKKEPEGMGRAGDFARRVMCVHHYRRSLRPFAVVASFRPEPYGVGVEHLCTLLLALKFPHPRCSGGTKYRRSEICPADTSLSSLSSLEPIRRLALSVTCIALFLSATWRKSDHHRPVEIVR